jgi:hypothetical protein
MKRLTGWLALLGLCVGLAGCGGSTGPTVTGTVTLDNVPLAGAVVTFRPAGKNTEGLGGTGVTGPDGKYTLTASRGGGRSIVPGDYTVVVSLRLRPDGSAPPPDVPPMESDAKETLPARYSEFQHSILRATVADDKHLHDFPLKKK